MTLDSAGDDGEPGVAATHGFADGVDVHRRHDDMDQATGLATFTPISLTVQANRAWTIQVNGNAAFWTASAGAWASKPVSDLIWSLTPAGPTSAMSTTATTLTTGSAGPGSPGVIRLHAPNRALGDRQAGQLLDDREVHHDDAVSGGQVDSKKGSRKRLPFFLRFRILLLNLHADDARLAAALLGFGFAHTLS